MCLISVSHGWGSVHSSIPFIPAIRFIRLRKTFNVAHRHRPPIPGRDCLVGWLEVKSGVARLSPCQPSLACSLARGTAMNTGISFVQGASTTGS
jgi:hypothetical protein